MVFDNTTSVKIVEVSPRDGLQNEKKPLDTQTKIEFIKLLALSGLENIEIGSFVSPTWIPQMANTKEVLQGLEADPEINYSALIPNLTGLESALKDQNNAENKLGSIAIFTAASETFCQKNINCGIEQSFARFEPVIAISKKNNLPIRGYISCALGCPYEGSVDIKKVIQVAKQLYDHGCYEISLGDTIGVGTASQVQELITQVSKVVPLEKLAVHFHNTYGQALVNVYAALQMGVRTVDASVAGLGGCPYAKGASGNLATEDLLFMLNGLGIKTNIDINKLIKAGYYICDKLAISPRSNVALAMPMQ